MRGKQIGDVTSCANHVKVLTEKEKHFMDAVS